MRLVFGVFILVLVLLQGCTWDQGDRSQEALIQRLLTCKDPPLFFQNVFKESDFKNGVAFGSFFEEHPSDAVRVLILERPRPSLARLRAASSIRNAT
jgi:hypothetical protein